MMANVKLWYVALGCGCSPSGRHTDRAKYNQGVKFYQPEIVDTPETVEYLGVKNLVQAAIKHFGTAPADEKLVFDFTNHRKT